MCLCLNLFTDKLLELMKKMNPWRMGEVCPLWKMGIVGMIFMMVGISPMVAQVDVTVDVITEIIVVDSLTIDTGTPVHGLTWTRCDHEYHVDFLGLGTHKLVSQIVGSGWQAFRVDPTISPEPFPLATFDLRFWDGFSGTLLALKVFDLGPCCSTVRTSFLKQDNCACTFSLYE